MRSFVACCALLSCQAPPAARASDSGTTFDAAVPPLVLPRNVILFMGDGMGPEQLSTGGLTGGHRLRLDALAGPALVNTDSLTTIWAEDPDLAPTDSAAAATAIATGVLVPNDVLSLSLEGDPMETVLEVCKSAGKAAGLVTTSYFFDASPAAFAAHQPSRGLHREIVAQMIGQTRPDVILGAGGFAYDDPAFALREQAARAGYLVVRTRADLAAWDPLEHPRLLGLFDTDFVPATRASETFSMTPALERRVDSPDPTLATMTARALERLAGDPDGFFLFVEDEGLDSIGHRGPAEVDWANRAYPAEVAALDDAVGVALDWVLSQSSFGETLIVVLSDHETGGYAYDHALGPASGTFSAFTTGEFYDVGHHTRIPVAVYALGPGSDSLPKVRDHTDTHALILGRLR